MTTETAQRVIEAWMDWKRCSALSCDGRMIQEACAVSVATETAQRVIAA